MNITPIANLLAHAVDALHSADPYKALARIREAATLIIDAMLANDVTTRARNFTDEELPTWIPVDINSRGAYARMLAPRLSSGDIEPTAAGIAAALEGYTLCGILEELKLTRMLAEAPSMQPIARAVYADAELQDLADAIKLPPPAPAPKRHRPG